MSILGMLLTLLTMAPELSTATRRLNSALRQTIIARWYSQQGATAMLCEEEKNEALRNLANKWRQSIALNQSKAHKEAASKAYLTEMDAIIDDFDSRIASHREVFGPR